MSMTISTAFTAWVDAPGRATLARLQAEITRDESFDRSSVWQHRAGELMDQQRHDEVIRLIMSRMPGLLLSPAAHAMLAVSYEAIRDTGNARREAFYRDLTVQAVLDSGSGTADAPWLVLHVADEYAALAALGLVPEAQRVEAHSMDVITCSDGSERWFKLV